MKPLPSVIMLTLALCSVSQAQAGQKTLADFNESNSLRWQTVNDNVMGGRSKGAFTISKNKALLFKGRTSLRNNGGFSSIRTDRQMLGLKNYKGLALRVRGDGRAYKVTLRTSDTSRWISFWADFQTKSGEWQDIRIPFSQFSARSFGSKRRARLSTDSINSIGFMIYDKKAGEFSLEVSKIAAYNDVPTAEQNIVEVASNAGIFKTLLAAAKAAGLVEALSGPGPMTILAPTDKAFAKIPAAQLRSLLKPENGATLKAILSHHVFPGAVSLKSVVAKGQLTSLTNQRVKVQLVNGSVKIGNAQVITADIRCSNGVVHAIDTVILPALDSIPQVASKAGQFKTLLAAAKAAGLVEALAGKNPITIFAPTDQAFAALPKGTVALLLSPEQRPNLIRILKHHIVAGRVFSDTAINVGTATTLAGTTIEIRYKNSKLEVSGAPIVKTDIQASNGVIHVIGKVLLPAATKKKQKSSF
jgi:transforming growth factor-beta-induced protein